MESHCLKKTNNLTWLYSQLKAISLHHQKSSAVAVLYYYVIYQYQYQGKLFLLGLQCCNATISHCMGKGMYLCNLEGAGGTHILLSNWVTQPSNSHVTVTYQRTGLGLGVIPLHVAVRRQTAHWLTIDTDTDTCQMDNNNWHRLTRLTVRTSTLAAESSFQKTQLLPWLTRTLRILMWSLK